ncbi:unnamed protein product [Leptidea sinapis]|uniref:RING-type E3 ubiquitin transferase n=2 Tax=Leptidea sinapis TaxID=189913 RepID=A0A5E4Q4S5_9NEOP|nr:unnamed protein product [Leptidea sinapis]
MADAIVMDTAAAVRYFCHRCNAEFDDVSQDYKCPFCASGFVEEMENGANGASPGQGLIFMDASMSNSDDTSSLHEEGVAELLDIPAEIRNLQAQHQDVPPVLRDIALLVSEAHSRGTGRGTTRLMTNIAEMLMGDGRAPATTTTANTAGAVPFVLLGEPGDYLFSGEALDAVVTQLLGQLEHSGPPPMPRDKLDAIPTEIVTEEQAAAKTPCSVCWENFQTG